MTRIREVPDTDEAHILGTDESVSLLQSSQGICPKQGVTARFAWP